ncbi:PfkB family carbohydrate kinase [Micromonospora sp. NPDC048830]|uniref:PfkB family carbohydrate kinase n=1 Tax=Micromonospora sp. NPDC048830 TaxID=3364257 RepID=UPI003717388A
MLWPNELRSFLSTVIPTSLVGVGDNVLDCYLEEDLAYPGGNALNVAVYARLFFGSRAGYIGVFGDDRFAAHLRGTLDQIGVDATRSRVAAGPNGMAFVSLGLDGDRRFVGSNRGGVQSILRVRIAPDDRDYLAGFASVHTSVYSSLDAELGTIAESCQVSYDFSTERSEAVIAAVAPHLAAAFFSGDGLGDADIDTLGAFAVARGAARAVVTRGSRGAVAYESGTRRTVGIRATQTIDTLGAGDAFIAGFLSAMNAGADLDQCLDVASAAGALACTYRGAFGYPVEAGPEARAQLIRRYETP